ncbi:MAG: S66 peptidase family protein [Salibacteraceae bacterium]
MKIPPSLIPGNCIAIVAPAKIIHPKEIEYAIQEIESRGFKVQLGENLFNSWNRFAGTDEERLLDLQSAIDNPEIHAILFARGGYGSVRLIDQLDFSRFEESPKWIIGYSDITVFHNHINANSNVATCHGTMTINMIEAGEEKKSTSKMLDLISGIQTEVTFPHYSLNKIGSCRGEVFGGNLSVLNSLIGTNSMVNPNGKILFIEDLCEELYHLDRMLYQLKKAQVLDSISGLLVGSFTDMTDVSNWFGKETALEIIKKHTLELDIPIAFNFPAGHQSRNYPLVMGKDYSLVVSNKESCLK